MIGGEKQKTDGESGIKGIESLVSEFQGLWGGMSIFQKDISLFDSTCLRDSIPNGIAVHHPASPRMLLSRNGQHDNTQEIPVNRIRDGCRMYMSMRIRLCLLSLCQPTIWA